MACFPQASWGNIVSAEISNKTLCWRIAHGCAKTEVLFYSRFIELSLQEAYRWLKHREDSQDIAHDALVSVLCRLRREEVADPDRLEGYVRRTTKYISLAYLRRHGVSRTHVVAEIPEEVAGSTKDTLAEVLNKELDNRINNLVEHLDVDRDKVVIKGHYLDDLSKSDLCSQLNLNSRQFDRVAHRARQRLRRLVEQRTPELLEEYA